MLWLQSVALTHVFRRLFSSPAAAGPGGAGTPRREGWQYRGAARLLSALPGRARWDREKGQCPGERASEGKQHAPAVGAPVVGVSAHVQVPAVASCVCLL